MSNSQNKELFEHEVKLGLLEKSIESSFFYHNEKRNKYQDEKYYIKNL